MLYPHAPHVYRTLVFSLIENRTNDLVRSFMLSNMQTCISAIPSLPIGVVVEPLVAQGAATTSVDGIGKC